MDSVARLIELERRLRQCETPAQLYYTLVNRIHDCIPSVQSVLLVPSAPRPLQVVAASDVATIDFTAPFISWIEQLASDLTKRDLPLKPTALAIADAPAELTASWRDYVPEYLLWLPLSCAASEKPTGYLLLFRDTLWTDAELAQAQHLCESMGHALFALRRPLRLKQWLQRMKNRRVAGMVALGLLVVLCWPVRLSAIAPVEVIARDPQVISAPMNGVVREIHIEPNADIQAGQLLLSFEDTELSSELDVAEQSLNVAEAELRTIQHSGFLDPSLKAELAEREARVKLKTAERDYAAQMLSKASVTAPGQGIAVLEDPNYWRGRPVKVGERIILLASPDQVELEIMLAVKDSITLEEGARVNVFFDHAPLQVWRGQVEHASYKPAPTPDGQMAYRLIAALDSEENTDLPRIGLRGTARVYGESVSLFFLLFRRPMTSLRQWLGW